MEGILPKIWKRAVVIPFVKPGKNPTNPGSYWPIALTLNLCKLMENIIVYIDYLMSKKRKVNYVNISVDLEVKDQQWMH